MGESLSGLAAAAQSGAREFGERGSGGRESGERESGGGDQGSREFSAQDLTSRWLTVEQVLGRRIGQASALSAVEPAFPALDLVAADTAVASRWFTADPAPGKLAGRTVVLPFVAVAELATWPERLLWGHSRTEDLSLWADRRRMILGDDTVCRIWARITVAAQRAGSPPPANDSWIAAGCLSYGLPLATQDKRHYRYFADRYGLQLL
ncbi:hypothetical protein Caci_0926 [Catenulispora acidiphila DSM 44928]|uniref:PIN domain-containing protein n=1 Tax=Catenulispora acidiphila (strain DSM 44928 / JCM 14897 / NBRC 102108 / NRRL B-24433 / ID139908) TaxID=479433 RepID=C7Q2L6_CATAD|nr:PIN domain-containing protein [Catenulispora acidiphila]ACU69858.1 hypothetical protein Caci_0926 [Catenulispora acidiphila DSM 44928]